MAIDLSKLNIIKNTPDPLSLANGLDPKLSEVSNQPTTQIAEPSNVSKLCSSYDEVRSGKLSSKDFQRKLLNLDPTMTIEILRIDPRIKDKVKEYLIETLCWYIELRILISTGFKIDSEELKNNSDLNIFLDKINQDNFKNLNQKDPKECSYIIRDLLKVFVNDDVIQPKYNIDSDMVMYLSNMRPTFLNEINVLFDLYQKVYFKLSDDLVAIVECGEDPTTRNKIEQFVNSKVSDIQPRFEMINRHILSSNLSTRIDYDLDLAIVGLENPSPNAKISQLSLQKRLNYLNSWLINGIIHTITQINRLNGLKPEYKQNSTYNLGKENFTLANTKFDIWQILQDTGKFLDSLKGLTDGSATITGIKSNDILDILEVNY